MKNRVKKILVVIMCILLIASSMNNSADVVKAAGTENSVLEDAIVYQNLALGNSVTVTASASTSKNPAKNAVDGNRRLFGVPDQQRQ